MSELIRILVLLVLCASLASGCVPDPEFSSPAIVNTWRVLAIVADPPEANPGEDITLTALVVDPDGQTIRLPAEADVRFRWQSCLADPRVGALSGFAYNPEQPIVGCEGMASDRVGELPVMEDDVALLPGAITAGLFERLEMLAPLLGEVLGDDLPPEVLADTLREVGLPITVQLTVERASDGAVLVRAFKRLTISEREGVGTNPPAPTFQIGEFAISGQDGAEESFRCAPADGGVAEVDANTRVTLAPSEDDEAWREPYLVVDVRGEIIEHRERPYYSWFSTGGSFDQEITAAPAREELWRTPATPGSYPLWVVVRDGHGGTSACETTIEVR